MIAERISSEYMPNGSRKTERKYSGMVSTDGSRLSKTDFVFDPIGQFAGRSRCPHTEEKFG
ncbi:MAG: hypothetical protein MZV70_54630 [Desulfobacterales bacterium]|nr:hypothetical protein [Desulfobacterales bacterium]